MQLAGKRIAVLGAGKSGFCAACLAASRGAQVTAFDSGSPEKLKLAKDKFAGEGIELITGDAALEPTGHFDCTVISPGIDASWPLAVALSAVSDELIGEIELAWRLSDIPVIAITGTNGKTTTTELIAHLLNKCGKSSVPAGNYGYAYSEVVLSGKKYDWVVLEVSSFQLETIADFHPRISLWMNFAADHMDRYDSLEDYRKAKLRIFENQEADDVAIIKAEELRDLVPRTITFSAFSDKADFTYSDKQIVGPDGQPILDFSKTRLNGKHNAENVMASLAAVYETGLVFDARLIDAVNRYQPPAHRCEVVGEKDGVIFVNDSKATNLHALASALCGQDEPVTLIVGGKNKGLNYAELNDVVSNTVATAICIGEMGPTIVQDWGDLVPCILSDSLEAAVPLAFQQKKDTRTILFSPGTSSFDMFSSYEERGDCFRKAVANFSK